MARARPIPDLTREMAYAEAAARIVTVRAGELAEHSHDVRDTAAIERLHNMRVATRRLRAALEVFAPCFPERPWAEALSEVKTIADALGERRDRDVTILFLERFEAAVPAADRGGIESLIATVREEQAEANEALAGHVAPDRLAALSERLTELVQAAERA